jgi:peptidoglycan/LPS O-acetylase OafA/YrhL
MGTTLATVDDATTELPRVGLSRSVEPDAGPGEAAALPARRGAGDDRLRSLDGLRFLAALAVVAYHYTAYGRGTLAWGVRPSTLMPTLSAPASYGWLGVQLFFLISGFVICMSAWGRSVGDFFVSRASRIYPAYWFSVLLITGVVLLWPTVGKPLQLREVLVNLTMLQAPLGVPHVDGIYWTLWVELVFYLLFSVVVWRGLTYRRVTAFCMIWTVAAVLLPALSNPLVNTLVMPANAPYFIAGIACFLIYRFGHSSLLWGVIGVNWIIAVLRMYPLQLQHARLLGKAAPAATWPALIVITAAFAFMILIASGRLGWLNWKWLTTAGALTYPVYLLHEYPGWTAIRALSGRLPWEAVLVVVTTGVIALAWAVHVFIEKPGGRWMRRSLTSAFAKIRRDEAAAAGRR